MTIAILHIHVPGAGYSHMSQSFMIVMWQRVTVLSSTYLSAPELNRFDDILTPLLTSAKCAQDRVCSNATDLHVSYVGLYGSRTTEG